MVHLQKGHFIHKKKIFRIHVPSCHGFELTHCFKTLLCLAQKQFMKNGCPLFDSITNLLSSQKFGTDHVRQRGTAKLHLKWLNCNQNKSLAHFQTHAEVLYPTVVTQHCINFSHPMSINADQVGKNVWFEKLLSLKLRLLDVGLIIVKW